MSWHTRYLCARSIQVHQGNCPQCDGPGPVDVHTSYRVYSVVMMTSWSSRPLVACARCGTKFSGTGEYCAVCEFRVANPFGSQMPPGWRQPGV